MLAVDLVKWGLSTIKSLREAGMFKCRYEEHIQALLVLITLVDIRFIVKIGLVTLG